MKAGEKILIEVQYFNGCPNSKEMIERVKEVIKGYEEKIEFKEVLVENNETAERVKFRGSPTVLFNGKDLLNEPAPDKPAMMCRYYKDGLPTQSKIQEMLQKLLCN